jgi:DNA-binding GntR family transcriptional regulator
MSTSLSTIMSTIKMRKPPAGPRTGARPDPPRNLAAGIAAALEEAIIAGRLGPRQRLIELEIGAAHGVSRAPVREALLMLQRDGLVVRAGRGFEVAGVSAAEAADMFEILAHLEELTTRLATPHLGAPGLRALRGILRDMAAVSRRDDVAAYYALNIRFHQIIRDACPNRPLIDLLDSLGKKTLRLRRLAMSIAGRMPVPLVEHQRILAVLEKGDAAAAGRRARESAEQAYAALAAFLRTNLLA